VSLSRPAIGWGAAANGARRASVEFVVYMTLKSCNH